MPETRHGLRESFPEAAQCSVNTAEMPLSNKIHRRQLANRQGIRPAIVKFNKFLKGKVWIADHTPVARVWIYLVGQVHFGLLNRVAPLTLL